MTGCVLPVKPQYGSRATPALLPFPPHTYQSLTSHLRVSLLTYSPNSFQLTGVSGCVVAAVMDCTLCSAEILWSTCVKPKAAFPGGSGHGCHHPPPCAAQCAPASRRDQGGNTLKSKLANIDGVLTCHC